MGLKKQYCLELNIQNRNTHTHQKKNKKPHPGSSKTYQKLLNGGKLLESEKTAQIKKKKKTIQNSNFGKRFPRLLNSALKIKDKKKEILISYETQQGKKLKTHLNKLLKYQPITTFICIPPKRLKNATRLHGLEQIHTTSLGRKKNWTKQSQQCMQYKD